MQIQFKKFEGKPSVLKCIRDDGSSTWVKMYPGIEAHDLDHFAVEKVLGFKNAFYGMVARGTNIEDFELPRDKRPEEVIPENLHPEALIAEHFVNLLMVKAQNSDQLDLLSTLNAILIEKKLVVPEVITPAKIDAIWDMFLELVKQWKELPFSETLEVTF